MKIPLVPTLFALASITIAGAGLEPLADPGPVVNVTLGGAADHPGEIQIRSGAGTRGALMQSRNTTPSAGALNRAFLLRDGQLHRLPEPGRPDVRLMDGDFIQIPVRQPYGRDARERRTYVLKLAGSKKYSDRLFHQRNLDLEGTWRTNWWYGVRGRELRTPDDDYLSAFISPLPGRFTVCPDTEKYLGIDSGDRPESLLVLTFSDMLAHGLPADRLDRMKDRERFILSAICEAINATPYRLVMGTSSGRMTIDHTYTFIRSAAGKHGEFGEKAARFLVDHMPKADKENLTAEFLLENLTLALKARETFPWAADVPEEIFFNDVLPYAVFDEPRDPWRAEFLELATPVVRDARTAAEAAQLLNRDFFKLINTHYHTGRERTNQSPRESIEQGKATCTGLSIILVAACRAVGIPARAAGTPLWWNRSGNHTWVEIRDDGEWHFTGADEYNENGLNRGWFTNHAARADADNPVHAIYATSWKKDEGRFLMAWAPDSRDVGGVNVTDAYTTRDAEPDDRPTIGVRFFNNEDTREAKPGTLTTPAGTPITTFTTHAGTTDLNDTPRVPVTPGDSYRFRFVIDGRPRETAPFTIDGDHPDIRDVRPADLTEAPDFSDDADDATPLTRDLAARAIDFTYESLVAEDREKRRAELDEKSITRDGHTMRWLEKTFGPEDPPPGGRSLWISMHGGGGAPERVNDQQWRNQIELYEPEEGIYVAPRAPTDTWNLWHQAHIDVLFARLIENMIALRGVNPDKIYLMGYSAGGDGVWQLAPRMADRFAAAAMMAGHPNDASLLGLRNLPFAIFMGGNDAAYNRNTVAAEKSEKLAALHEADPEGYPHLSRIYPGVGHWMNLRCAEALPWMAEFTRDPWPAKIVWHQSRVVHHRFYWLRVPEGTAEPGATLTATLDGRTIHLEGDVPDGTELLLSDHLLDLDEPVEIRINGGPPVEHRPVRTLATIRSALRERLDPAATPTAAITLP